MALGFGIGIPFIRRRGDGVDPDAAAFIAAAGITDPTQKAAINTLVKSLKAANLWSKMVALYPFVGGSATSHKYNLKDPKNLDAAFRIAWNGGVTHNSNGVTGNGTNAYGNTYIMPNLSLLLNDTGLSYLCSNTGIDGQILTGVTDGPSGTRYWHYPALNAGNATLSNINTSSATNTATLRQGFHTVQRTSSSNQNNYRNGVLGANAASVSGSLAVREIFFLCLNNGGTAGFFNTSNVRFLAYHTSLNATEASDLYNIQNTFQTTLGRAV